MRIRLLAVGRRMPGWVAGAFDDYARRLPRECRLELIEIAPGHRSGKRGGKNPGSARAIAEEDRRMLAAIDTHAGADAQVIALTVDGRSCSTEQLAASMRGWLADGRDRALLVGGADGLGPRSLARASQRWSLSPLTMAHPLVRVVLAEQLYRAHSILAGHPYHRG